MDSWTTTRQLGDKLRKKGWWGGLGGKKSVARDPPIVQTEIMKPRAYGVVRSSCSGLDLTENLLSISPRSCACQHSTVEALVQLRSFCLCKDWSGRMGSVVSDLKVKTRVSGGDFP